MEKTYFTSLQADARTEIAWNYGEVITTVETKDYYISLLLLDNFYVEIFIDKYNKELIEIGVQEDDDVLYEYIKDLVIDSIKI